MASITKKDYFKRLGKLFRVEPLMFMDEMCDVLLECQENGQHVPCGVLLKEHWHFTIPQPIKVLEDSCELDNPITHFTAQHNRFAVGEVIFKDTPVYVAMHTYQTDKETIITGLLIIFDEAMSRQVCEDNADA